MTRTGPLALLVVLSRVLERHAIEALTAVHLEAAEQLAGKGMLLPVAFKQVASVFA